MRVLSSRLTIYIPYAVSLKDKRMVAQSLIEKTRRKFNASIAEVDTQDQPKVLTIGVAVVSESLTFCRERMDAIHRAIQSLTDCDVRIDWAE